MLSLTCWFLPVGLTAPQTAPPLRIPPLALSSADLPAVLKETSRGRSQGRVMSRVHSGGEARNGLFIQV